MRRRQGELGVKGQAEADENKTGARGSWRGRFAAVSSACADKQGQEGGAEGSRALGSWWWKLVPRRWSLSDCYTAYRGPVELLCSTRLETSASRIAHHCDPAAASTT